MLQDLKSLFEDINHAKVKYCHWKSNIGLEGALAGDTDLDLLVCPDSKFRFEKIIAKYNIKRTYQKLEYKNIVNFVGIDDSSAKMYHLHVHYQIVTGNRPLKNFMLPYGEVILNEYTTSRNFVKVPTFNVEISLFIIRTLLKNRLGPGKIIRNFQGLPIFSLRTRDELDFLIQNIDKITLKKDTLKIFGSKLSILILEFIDKYNKGNYHLSNFIKDKIKLDFILRQFKRNNFVKVSLLKYYYWSLTKLSILDFGKYTFSDAKLISLVGIDGSGKSTISKKIVTWLSWKIKVKKSYLGRQANLQISLLNKVNFFKEYKNNQKNKVSNLLFFFNEIFFAFQMLLAAKQKHNIYKRAIKDSKAGIITVFDRYPYESFNKMAEPMDGPKISSLMKSQGMLRTIFSRLEREIYKKIKKPNLTIVLDTDPEVSHIRKPDHSLKILKEKYLAIQTFKSRNKCEVVDTDRKLEEVLEITKKKVWNVI